MDPEKLEKLAESIVAVIRTKPKQFHSYKSLAKKLQVERVYIEEALVQIVAWGYRVRRRRREAVAFIEAPDLLTATEIGNKLKTKAIGSVAHCYGIVRSTNDLAVQMAENGAVEGTIVTAEQQTQGRGRFGRTWYSPLGAGIYVSIILRPKFRPERAPGLSIMTALALAETLRAYPPAEVTIKWPNDVLLRGRKTAGILTELAAEKDRIGHVVVGVGINVNQKAGDFPPEIRDSATSLRRYVKRRINRVELLKSFLHHFEKEYAAFQKDGLKGSRARLRRLSSLINRNIRLQSGAHLLDGKAVDISPDGALILESRGHRLTISAGEVTVLKE
jgi:BirA family biotin operon repressor/biotin-[acetyl-CoA-carboxylase] ligase